MIEYHYIIIKKLKEQKVLKAIESYSLANLTT